MRGLATVVAKSGLLEESAIAELKRWGLPIVDVPVRPTTLENLVESLKEALESEDLVITRLTDFNVIQQYLSSQRLGPLHVVIEDGSAEFEITYGRTPTGDYILPWRSDSIKEEMTNGLTFLREGDSKVFFEDVQEVYFGDTKVFMLCKPMRSHDKRR